MTGRKALSAKSIKKVTNYFVIIEVAFHFYVCCINNTLIIDTENVMRHLKGKVFPLQARGGPQGGQRYRSTLP